MKHHTCRQRGKAEFRIGDYVRIQPSGSEKHFGRGRVVGIEGTYALVLPLHRHRHSERFLLSHLLPWKSANVAYRDLAARRARA